MLLGELKRKACKWCLNQLIQKNARHMRLRFP